MKWPYLFALIFAAVVHSNNLCGQFYTTGEAPASLRWKKISTPHFSIIFPGEISADAVALANRLEQYRQPTAEDTGLVVKSFPVVLHSTSVLSNGYVTLAPRRMELVSVPPQDGYAQDWISQLTLHEYRHAVQLSRMQQGFTRALSWFTGDIGPGSVSSMIPSWFHEGDAVHNETRLSEAGRGRIPGFEMPLRTILLQQPKNYSYDKAIFGSYRDYVPDQYRLGYQIVSFARSRYGAEIVPGALTYTARNPFLLWPLAFYLKRNYGVYKSGLYEQAMDSLKVKYNKQEDTVTYSKYVSNYPVRNRVYTRYTLPRDLGNGKVIALKNSQDDPGSFVVMDTSGQEKRLVMTGYTMGLACDLQGNRLVWDEVMPDPRWERRDFSVLRMLDLVTGKQQLFTRNTRYFSPAFSPGGGKIVVAETDLRNRHFVTVLDAMRGDSLLRIPVPGNRAVQFPRFINDSVVTVITVSERGKQLERIDLKQQQWKVILPFTRYDISEPLNYKQYMMFRSSFNGIENIYAVAMNHPEQLYQVTFSRFGAYHPSVSNDSTRLLFSNYTPAGFEIVSLPLDTLAWRPLAVAGQPLVQWTYPPEYRTTTAAADTFREVSYVAHPYRKGSDLFHFHSWTPFYYQLEDYTGPIRDIPVSAGFMLFSQNLLSTAISSIGYRYSQGYHALIPAFTWRGWYPVMEFSGQFNGPVDEFTARSYIPLVFNRGKYIAGIQPEAAYEYAGVSYTVEDESRKGIQYLHYKLYLNHYLRRSARDLYPRWGQSLTTTYTHTPFDQGEFGNLFSVQAGFFFPGVAPHHHFYGLAGMQRQGTGRFFLPLNRIRFPRGYPSAVSRTFTGLYLNYAFPVAYPDWSLGPLLYLKRLRLNVFHDWSYGTDIRERVGPDVISYTGSYRSFGAELLADVHVIRIIFPVSAGVRAGYMPGRNEFFAELMFSLQTGIF